MFQQTFLAPESSPRKGWSFTTSLACQALAVGAILLAPLLRVPALEMVRTPIVLTLPRQAPPPPMPATEQQASTVPSTNSSPVFRPPPPAIKYPTPSGIPSTDLPAPELTGSVASVPDTFSDSSLSSLATAPHPPAPPAPTVTHRAPVRVGSLNPSQLIYGPKPVYPPLAITTRTSGTVRLRAVIDREGRITNLQLISGHPLLVKAAMEAVQQWRYRPLLLNGEPIDIITDIDVNFSLN